MPSRSLKYLALAAPLFLAGCGDGWEMIRVTNMVPYGNSRTAGSGVAYVRKHLMPPKELNVAPAVTTTTTITTQQPEKVKSAEPVFRKEQQK